MPRLSQTLQFLQSPSTSTVCSDWPANTVHCDWPNTTSHIGNVTTPFHNRELQLSKLKTVNNVLSFTISSSPREEQSCVTDRCLYVFAHKPSWYAVITLSHARRTKLHIWTVKGKYLNYNKRNTVADSEAPDCLKVRMTLSLRFTKRSSIKCFVIHLCCAVLL